MSRTSSSWWISVEPHSAHASGVLSATVVCPSGQYHAGIRCPHQICREMHQSRMLSSQSSATAFCCSGVNVTRPSRIAAAAGSASGFIFTHHWSVISGSIRAPQRSQWPTECR